MKLKDYKISVVWLPLKIIYQLEETIITVTIHYFCFVVAALALLHTNFKLIPYIKLMMYLLLENDSNKLY